MDILELTKKLISIKSFSGDEKAVFDFTADWFRRNNFEYVRQDEMFVAALKTKTGAPKAIILSGHLDTVVSGEESLWSASPFEAVEESDKLIGLGSSDMKAAVAAQMLAVRDSERDDLDIWSVAVANEEIDGAGSEAFMKWFQAEFDYDEVVCVIGEPTDLGRIEIGHRGNRFVKLEFDGISGHASQQASFGTSALAKASEFLADIEHIVADINANFSDELMGSPSIVPTMISAGDEASPNKAAASAEIILDVRTTPQFDAEFEEEFANLAKKYDFKYTYSASPVASSLCDRDSSLVKNMIAASGVKEIAISLGATDQISFQSRGINTVVFGPGEFSQAHKVDEFIVMDKLIEYHAVLNKFLADYR